VETKLAMRPLSDSFMAVLLVFLVGVLQLHWQQIVSGLMVIPGDLGDARFVHLLLEWSYRWIQHPWSLDFWSPQWAFYPQGQAVAGSDTMIGSLGLYAPWRMLGLSEPLAFQLWEISCSIFNFWIAYWLFRVIGLTRFASALGSFLFAFSLARSGFLPHPQLLPHFWTPLTVLLVAKALRKNVGPIKGAILWASAGVCLGLQFWSSFYLGYLFLVAVLAAILGLSLVYRQVFFEKLKLISPSVLYMFLAAALLLLPLAYHYLSMAEIVGHRDLGSVLGSLPTIRAWLLPAASTWFYQDLFAWGVQKYPYFGEHMIFQGVVPSVCGLVCLALVSRFKDYPMGVVTVVAASLFFLLLRANADSIWNLFAPWLPGARSLRAMGRIGLVMSLILGCLVGLVWDQLAIQTKKVKTKRGFILIFLASFFVLEQFNGPQGSFNWKDSELRIKDLESTIRQQCHDRPFMVMADGPYAYVNQMDAMWASLDLGNPNIGGYSGVYHPMYLQKELGTSKTTDKDLNDWMAFFGKSNEKPCIIKVDPAKQST
jgi:hypothetical protein